jgi:hypothetical protein
MDKLEHIAAGGISSLIGNRNKCVHSDSARGDTIARGYVFLSDR